jgi:hypothetical protein
MIKFNKNSMLKNNFFFLNNRYKKKSQIIQGANKKKESYVYHKHSFEIQPEPRTRPI